MLSMVSVACLAFCSADIDDLIVLIALFADRDFRRRDIVIGQFAGIAVLYAASAIFALSALVVPRAWVGLLGFVPIVIGVSKLISLRHEDGGAIKPIQPARGGILTVASITIANGGDNLGAWIPLLATRSASEIAVLGLAFMALTAIWCIVANWLVTHPLLQAPLRRYGHRMVPFVLIGLGLIVLIEAGSLKLL